MADVVIIGADRGIGEAMVGTYRDRGETVWAVCYGDGDVWANSDVRVVPHIDVTNDGCIEQLRSALAGVDVDVVVHVSGVGSVDTWGAMQFDRMLEHYNLNALGPLRVAQALADNLREGGKWGIVTSRMASLADNGSGRMYSYRMSKAAANMLGINLFHEFKPRGVAVMLLHPGTVATQMTKGARNWDEFLRPEEAAAGLITQLDRLDASTPPEFRHSDGTLLPW
jgi:NAD(P)-dependent dehydrogenase (short-subunit alcohol dehydrogenase family)